MELREFFSEDAIKLDLAGTSKDDILRELIALLKLDEKSEGMLFKMLKRRENLGSTGIGRGIAIPHCRSLVVNTANADPFFLTLSVRQTPGRSKALVNDVRTGPIYRFDGQGRKTRLR